MTRPAARPSKSPHESPRPGPVQVGLGTLIATAATVALLAVSGETGVWRVAVLVAFGVALGTLSAVLLAARPRVAAPPAAPTAPRPPARDLRRPENVREYAHR
ncbi:hypothetical protein [Kitasatospora sp. NPDC004531]